MSASGHGWLWPVRRSTINGGPMAPQGGNPHVWQQGNNDAVQEHMAVQWQ